MPRESKAELSKRAGRIVDKLKAAYPDAHCELSHQGPLQLLVATILSAQCTDARVNQVTPDLFERYRSAKDFAQADQDELAQQIRSTGFYRNKAKNVIGAARRIVDEHGGIVPDTMEALTALPGVARKTANVVLGNAFGKAEGIVVDTHVTRVSARLKLVSTKAKTAEKIETELTKLIDRDDWTLFAHLLIFHGRRCCTARSPACDRCPVAGDCPSAGKV